MRERIMERLRSIDDLPLLPQVVIRVQEEMSSPNVTASSIARIIENDPPIALKVLRVANSVLYNPGIDIVDIRQAILRLGLDEVYKIVLAMSTLRIIKGAIHVDYNQFWRHSISVAFATKAIVEFSREKSDNPSSAFLSSAFVAGLLHDMGILVMDQYLPDVYVDILKTVKRKGEIPLYGVEEEMLGISHAEVGGFLLRRWRFPEPVVVGVECHHIPDSPGEGGRIAKIVHVADFVCNNQSIDNGTGVLPIGFSDSAWEDLGMLVDDIEGIIDAVRKEAEKSPVLMALASS